MIECLHMGVFDSKFVQKNGMCVRQCETVRMSEIDNFGAPSSIYLSMKVHMPA